jgi:negative elongation factor C/D
LKERLLTVLLIVGADVHDVEQIVEDHLKTLIVQNFDAKKADSIFTEEGGVRSQQSTKTSHTLVAQDS